MGLLAKLFGWKITCPLCGAPQAQDSFAGVHCRNPQCRHYDPQYAQASRLPSRSPTTPYDAPRREKDELPSPASDRVVHFPNPLNIDYTNARQERKVFVCERESLRTTPGSRISARVEPAGIRIGLDPKRIHNLAEVKRALQALEPDFAHSIPVVYQNHRGEQKTFQVAKNSVRYVGNALSVCVAPRKKRIALHRDRILNWSEVERQLR